MGSRSIYPPPDAESPQASPRTKGPAVAARVALGLLLASTVASQALAHAPGVVLSGSGTATVDGVLSPGEWDGAATVNFQAVLPAADGGGTSPATLFVMNDANNLYLGVRVNRSRLNTGSVVGFGLDTVSFEFDNNHSGSGIEEGDDVLALSGGRTGFGFLDAVRTKRPPCPLPSFCGLPDVDVGGTSDGQGAAANDGSFTFFEISHPLNSADDPNDFSLGAGSTVGFSFSMNLSSVTPSCSGGCSASTIFPAGKTDGTVGAGDSRDTSLRSVGPGDIVIALDTTIADGPARGSYTGGRASFTFSGTDNVTRPGGLSFSCSLDGGTFEPCASPKEYVALTEGPHTFAVRARDAAGNFDPSPAQRSWTADLTPPDTTITDGPTPGSASSSTTAIFSFSGSDNFPEAPNFECSLDGLPFAPCASPYEATTLAEGSHVFAVRARDLAGNVDPTPEERTWTVDVTPPETTISDEEGEITSE